MTQIVKAKIGTSISKLVKSLIKARPKPKKETMPIPQMKPKPKTKKPEAPVKPKIKKPIDAAAKQFMPKKPVAGMGINRRRPKSKIMKLQQDYEALKPSAKRAERAKGQNSRFYLVFKKLGMTTATPTVKKRHGGMSRVGLEPATEARAGTLSEAARRRLRVPTPVRPAPILQPPVRPTPTLQPPVRPALRPPVPQMVPRRPMNKGGTISRKMSGQEVVDRGYKGFV